MSLSVRLEPVKRAWRGRVATLVLELKNTGTVTVVMTPPEGGAAQGADGAPLTAQSAVCVNLRRRATSTCGRGCA